MRETANDKTWVEMTNNNKNTGVKVNKVMSTSKHLLSCYSFSEVGVELGQAGYTSLQAWA